MKMRATTLPIYQKQADFRQSRAWLRGFVAGRGSGKTRIGAIDVCLRARAGEPWMVISPSYAIVDETTWPTFREVAEQLGVWIRGVKSKPNRAWIRTQDHGIAEVVFRTGDKPEQLRGPSKAGLWIDEASIMREDAFKLAIPGLRYKGRMGPCLMTFTPKGRKHWTFSTFYDRLDDNLQDELSDSPIGSDGCSLLPDYLDCKNIAGIFYRPSARSHLVQARTIDNPFLPEEFFATISGHYSSALAAQELGGEFVELEGMIFRREWFRLTSATPADAIARVRYWDRAATEGGGSYTAGLLMSRDARGMFTIEDVVRGQWSAMERDEIILQTAKNDARRHQNTVSVYVEQEPGSGGKEAAAQMVRLLAGFPVYVDVVGGRRYRSADGMRLPGEAKVVRAQPLAAQVEAGNVRVLDAKWSIDFLEEICAFPESSHSDQVDAASGSFNKLATHASLGPISDIHRPEVRVDPDRHGVQIILDRAKGRALR